jgi:hypothetical protein
MKISGTKKILDSSGATRERRKKKPEKLPSKILSANGTLEVRRVKCGRSNCKCARGELHGPYTYVRTYRGGKRHRVYVRSNDVPALKEARSEHKESRASSRDLMQLLRKLSQETKNKRTLIQSILRGDLER